MAPKITTAAILLVVNLSVYPLLLRYSAIPNPKTVMASIMDQNMTNDFLEFI